VLQRLRAVRQNVRQNHDGFTLVELLIVIVILGILAGIVVFAVNGITDKGVQSACKADVHTVQVASEAYYAQKGIWASGIGTTGSTDTTTLTGSGLLQSAPNSDKYTVTLSAAGQAAGVLNDSDGKATTKAC
jgi:general secretion pathway protein G